MERVYNFGVILRCLKQYRLIQKRQEFVNEPEKKQFLEWLLTIVVQYFQPHVSYSMINIWLDDIVQEVLTRLQRKHPAHSIFSTSSEQFSFWRNNNIDDNFWEPTQARQIMREIEEFIFSELEARKLHRLWTTLGLEDKIHVSYINYIYCVKLYAVCYYRTSMVRFFFFIYVV